MGERIEDLSHGEFISIGSGDRTGARRRFRLDLLQWCLGIFVAISFGLATILITAAGPTLASNTPTSPTLSAQNRGTGKAGAGKAGTRAAGPCVDKTKRYVDCGNGTVTDSMTGLIWLKQSNCLPTADWEAAKKAAAGLKNGDCMLMDGSSPGDWRLPTDKEWEETMKNANDMQCSPGPMLTNDTGNMCMSVGPSSFTGVESDYYWSSTSMEGQGRAYFGDIDHGHVLNATVTTTLRVWPVRGGKG